ncbi:MAG: phosphodiester glycosidase family protein [Frankiales bacterium]|nr:phosphodiester glycosidase family protein [Frankiales bacterium]
MPNPRKRAASVTTAALLAALAAVPAAVPASAGGHHSPYTTNCPPAESLIRGTTWHTHRLAPGVVLQEGQRHDHFEGQIGTVDMHVLTVATLTKHVHFAPLMHSLAERSKLSELASGKRRLIAATNTGFYDFRFGTPQGPVVTNGVPLLAYRSPKTVVGFTADKHVQAAQLALAGTVKADGVTFPLAALNVLDPPTGLTAYTSRWGSQYIPLPRDAVARYVNGGRVTSSAGRYNNAPSSGYLLVARGQSAYNFVRSTLHNGDTISATTSTRSTARAAFTQAYAVGTQVVVNHQARTNMLCRREYPQPARTAIGFADKGRKLILAIIADHPGTTLHGLDTNQVARVMLDLGASQAYMFDGSGSTELLARLRSHPHTLSLRNYPADGGAKYERPMPVGLGIYYTG